MNYRLLQPGPMAACCYLVWDEQTGSAVLIDPGAGADALRRTLDTAGLRLRHIFLTHLHYDHIGAVDALRDGEVLAGASSYSSYPGGIEIEIDTRKDQRRQGLARACGARLMLECLERGLFPSWDAANKTSAHLAETLGYRFREEYVVYELEN